jgi:osmotically inducible protein OsmC
MERKATAIWKGPLKGGRGTVTTPSGVLKDHPYTFSSRFEGDPQTNPEELVAAAHASCFAMALSAKLSDAGTPVETLEATSTVTLGQKDGGWSVTGVHLDVTADVPGVDTAKFDELANDVKANCIVSRLLNAPITMRASLRAKV